MPSALPQRTPRAAPRKRWTLHIISDATGNLASHIIHSITTQFPGVHFRLVYHLFQKDAAALERTLSRISGRNVLALHALLDPELKRLTHEICRLKRIDDFDLTGSLVQFIADHTHTAPVNELSRLHHTGPGYFRRIKAMEFTAQHDDNRRLDSIGEAQIVIVGLSRVSKSPTSYFLGAMGYRVANVAIAPETGFPPELDAVADRTVALTIRPKELWEIRRRRFSDFRQRIQDENLDDLPYYNLRSIIREVAWAEREYRRRSYPIINISGRTVEETGSLVLTSLHLDQEDMFYPTGNNHDPS